MLYFFCGTDTDTARSKMNAVLEALVAKKPDASVIRVRADAFDPGMLPAYIGGQGLFESKQIVVLDHVCADAEIKHAVLEARKEMAASPNLFFVLEGNLDKATAEKFKRAAEKFEISGELGRTKKEPPSFNTFALSDALGARDRKGLWVLLQEGKRHHVSDEEMHGVLFWQAKSMLLAAQAHSTESSGLNPFVFRKAKGFLENYAVDELQHMLRQLTALPHEARRGRFELASALERFVLSI